MTDDLKEYPVYADDREVGSVRIIQNGQMTVFDCTCAQTTPDIFRLAAFCDGRVVPLGVLIPEGHALRLKKSFSKNALSSLGYEDTRFFQLIHPGDMSAVAAFLQDTPTPITPDEPTTVPADQTTPLPEPSPVQSAPEIKAAAEAVLTSGQDCEPSSPSPPPESRSAPERPETPSDGGWRPIDRPRSLFTHPSIADVCQEVTGGLVTERGELTMLAVPVDADAPFPLMPIFCFGTPEQIGGHDYLVFKIKNGSLTL